MAFRKDRDGGRGLFWREEGEIRRFLRRGGGGWHRG